MTESYYAETVSITYDEFSAWRTRVTMSRHTPMWCWLPELFGNDLMGFWKACAEMVIKSDYSPRLAAAPLHPKKRTAVEWIQWLSEPRWWR